MSQAQAAADRLPWLSDEPTPPQRRTTSSREVAGWASAAVLLIAGASYWMGAHSGQKLPAPTQAARPSTTVALPQPQVTEPPQPQVALEPEPQVVPAPVRQVPIARPRIEKRPVHRQPAEAPIEEAPAAVAPPPVALPAPQPVPSAAPKPLTLWPATQSQGADGRIVRIGAFGSRLQAKLGWRYMVEIYPAVAHLPAAVVETRNSRGRAFYRFQIGTTSQAHSEVLCQRMERIRLSCAVVGLPWKPKGVER